MELKDRRVWLIGASSGIGEALVPALTAAGARIAISARRADLLTTVAARNERSNRGILVKPLDVTVKGELERAAAELRTEWEAIDVMIYNAGAWSPVEVEHFDVEECERQAAVNYIGLIRAVGAVLPNMIGRGRGEIAGVASVVGFAGFPRSEAYGSSKAAAIAFLQSLRLDLRRLGIGATTINPGFVDTPLTQINKFAMPFLLKPEDAAARIVKGLLAGESEIAFPRRLTIPLKLYTALPRPVFEWIAGRMMARS